MEILWGWVLGISLVWAAFGIMSGVIYGKNFKSYYKMYLFSFLTAGPIGVLSLLMSIGCEFLSRGFNKLFQSKYWEN